MFMILSFWTQLVVLIIESFKWNKTIPPKLQSYIAHLTPDCWWKLFPSYIHEEPLPQCSGIICSQKPSHRRVAIVLVITTSGFGSLSWKPKSQHISRVSQAEKELFKSIYTFYANIQTDNLLKIYYFKEMPIVFIVPNVFINKTDSTNQHLNILIGPVQF